MFRVSNSRPDCPSAAFFSFLEGLVKRFYFSQKIAFSLSHKLPKRTYFNSITALLKLKLPLTPLLLFYVEQADTFRPTFFVFTTGKKCYWSKRDLTPIFVPFNFDYFTIKLFAAAYG